ncbi:MAG: hypothetical protein RLN78_05815 [Phycisphaerales bacterium]
MSCTACAVVPAISHAAYSHDEPSEDSNQTQEPIQPKSPSELQLAGFGVSTAISGQTQHEESGVEVIISKDPQLADPEPNFDEWASETFALPPGFAPDLPVGSESLLFPPGWRDPDSENFWSYAFVMTIDEQPPEASRVQELLELYYDGLMSVFASGKQKESHIKPTKVVVNQIKTNQYVATMHLVDAFATFEPVEIKVRIETVAAEDGHSQVRVQISRQPDEHQIWKDLSAAIEHILESPPSEKHP